MLITLLPQSGNGNYSAPNHINYRAGCARARSSFSETTPNYPARARHSQRPIERNFRHGDGENLRPPRLSWLHPISTRGHVDGDDDEDDGHDAAYDDADQGDADDGDDPATAAAGAAGHRAASIESLVIWRPSLSGAARRERDYGG